MFVRWRAVLKTGMVATFGLIVQLSCSGAQQPAAQAPANTSLQQKTGIQLTSTALKEGESIPRQYTCDGIDISPPLEWTGLPKSAKTIALVVDDPDAPSGTFVHWVLYNLPADGLGLIENTPPGETLKAGGMQGKNDFGKIGYGGPCPPSGKHRHFFKVFALEPEISFQARAAKRA